ncbi:MAG TPA: hypothetical protein VFB76_17785, partial [Candidatus Angelobacter sp.]|nr:hypothetical protein [Candidatus Angelobacter sp.]
KKAGLLLYSMQLALQTVGQVTFGQVKTGELVRETVDEDAALSSQHSAFSQNQQQNQNQTPTTETLRHGEEENVPQINADKRRSEEEERQGLPLMGTDDADKEPGLAGMTVDNRGLEKMRKPVEWRPPAEVFRMDTREGMEAYEASFRMKIRTSGDLVIGRSGDRTGDALQKLDIAQTCANLG